MNRKKQKVESVTKRLQSLSAEEFEEELFTVLAVEEICDEKKLNLFRKKHKKEIERVIKQVDLESILGRVNQDLLKKNPR